MPDRPYRCPSHAVGHTPHWIQAKLSRESKGTAVRLVAVDGNEVVLAMPGGARRSVWTHDPDRLVGMADRRWVLRSHGVLAVHGDSGSLHIASVADHPIAPCDHGATDPTDG